MRFDGVHVSHAFEFFRLADSSLEYLPSSLGNRKIGQHIGEYKRRALLIAEIVGTASEAAGVVRFKDTISGQMFADHHCTSVLHGARPHFPIRAVDQARVEAAVLFVKVTTNHHSGELKMGAKMEVPAVIEHAF